MYSCRVVKHDMCFSCQMKQLHIGVVHMVGMLLVFELTVDSSKWDYSKDMRFFNMSAKMGGCDLSHV